MEPYKLEVIEVKPNREFELKNRKELLHPEVEKYILELEAENSKLWLAMLNDMCHYGDLDSNIKKDMGFLYKMAAYYLKPDVPVTEGMCPTFYLTTTAEGDAKLVNDLKEIKRKYELGEQNEAKLNR